MSGYYDSLKTAESAFTIVRAFGFAAVD